MSIIKWHKKQVKKNLNMFGLSNYQGFWISFIKGLLFGAISIWFLSCNEQDVVKKDLTGAKTTTNFQSDYSVGVKGNCGTCKSTIEKAVKGLDFVKNAEWGSKTKILDVEFIDSVNFDLEALNSAINESGYETMNTTANQSAYDALPPCCKYDRNMVVYALKSEKAAKTTLIPETKTSGELQSDYSIGVKGNCGMCKSTIEKAVKGLDFVKNAKWGIVTKILDVEFTDSVNFDLEAINKAINKSGYETMNTTADQKAYDALPMCCKYDRNMVVYGSKSE